MFKKIKVMSVLCLLFGSASAYAAEAEGLVTDIMVCGTGGANSNNWIRTILFKVDSKWFGTYADYYSGSQPDYDNDLTTSLLMMAYTTGKNVKVKFSDEWNSAFSVCGIPTGSVFHATAGDYFRVSS